MHDMTNLKQTKNGWWSSSSWWWSSSSSKTALLWMLLCIAIAVVVHVHDVFGGGVPLQQKQQQARRQLLQEVPVPLPQQTATASIRIFGPASLNDNDISNDKIIMSWYTADQRRQFLQEHGSECWPWSSSSSLSTEKNVILQRYEEAFATAPFLQVELWKFCVFYTQRGNVFWDPSQVVPLISWDDMWNTKDNNHNDHSTALLVTFPSTVLPSGSAPSSSTTTARRNAWIHSSFLRLDSTEDDDFAKTFSQTMLRLLVETDDIILTSNPLYTYQAMAQLIQNDNNNNVDKTSAVKVQVWTAECHQVPSPPHNNNPADQVLVLPQRKQSQQKARRRRNQQRRRPQQQQQQQKSLLLTLEEEELLEFSHLPTFGLHCTIPGGYCCQVWQNDENHNNINNDDDVDQMPIFMVKHPFGTSGGTSTTSSTTITTTTRTTDAGSTPTSSRTDPQLHNEKQHAHVQHQLYPAHPVPYWSTITAVSMQQQEKDNDDSTSTPPPPPVSKLATPNFFDILLQNNCLPTSPACQSCLKRYRSPPPITTTTSSSTGGGGAVCDEQCTRDCPCYCKALCRIRPPPKHVSAVWYVAPPLVQQPPEAAAAQLDDNDAFIDAGRRSQRMIPRIVHQTWYEPVTSDKYPNMSRLQQSWKQSGWTHHFYDDASSARFLHDHFPPAVLEAYHAIQPGAFKADLFRYCVLLIQGGVYADMDVLLETNLEEAIAPNVGFMTPMDEPGIKVGQQACLWNGFMAVAPGHPFVAKTIELVVNNIRNRFTSVDYDDMLCPNPVLSASHLWDILFTTGPCILGTAMNLVLQRHPQTGFKTGELDIWGIHDDNDKGETTTTEQSSSSSPPQQGQSSSSSSSNKPTPKVEPNDPRLAIPGRSIILRQNKNDMGAHRFTLEERNLIICSTDMPDYDDRPKKPHYAESGRQTSLYGTTQLYLDFVSANEEIRVVVVGNLHNYTL